MENITVNESVKTLKQLMSCGYKFGVVSSMSTKTVYVEEAYNKGGRRFTQEVSKTLQGFRCVSEYFQTEKEAASFVNQLKGNNDYNNAKVVCLEKYLNFISN